MTHQELKDAVLTTLREALATGLTLEQIAVKLGIDHTDKDAMWPLLCAIDKSIDLGRRGDDRWTPEAVYRYRPIFYRGRGGSEVFHAHLLPNDIPWRRVDDGEAAYICVGSFDDSPVITRVHVTRAGGWWACGAMGDLCGSWCCLDDRADGEAASVLHGNADEAKAAIYRWVFSRGASLLTDDAMWAEMARLTGRAEAAPADAEERRAMAAERRSEAEVVLAAAEMEAGTLRNAANECDAYAAQLESDAAGLLARVADLAAALRK